MHIQVLEEEYGAQFSHASLVLGSSLVFSADDATAYSLNPFDPTTDLLQEEVGKRIVRQEISDGYEFQFTEPPVKIGTIETRVFPLCTTHPYNYYHFLIEALPDLLFFIKSGLIKHDTVILTGHLDPNLGAALRMVLEKNNPPILTLDFNQKIDCHHIVAGRGGVHGTERIDDTLGRFYFRDEVLQGLRDHFKKYWDDSAGGHAKKLYVARQSRGRHLVNSQELEAAAISAGYQVVHPEQLGIFQQAQLFSSADRIIGPTGAWLANLIFTREDTPVTVLYPQTCMVEQSLWNGLGKVFSIPVQDVYCPVVKLNESQPIHSDFACPLDQFRDLL